MLTPSPRNVIVERQGGAAFAAHGPGLALGDLPLALRGWLAKSSLDADAIAILQAHEFGASDFA
jgi:hypothetical protein